MFNSKLSNVNHPHYDEAKALQQLMKSLDSCVEELNQLLEAGGEDYFANMTITVGNTTTAFVLGGPTYQAMQDFITSIAEENGYKVDKVNRTVK